MSYHLEAKNLIFRLVISLIIYASYRVGMWTEKQRLGTIICAPTVDMSKPLNDGDLSRAPKYVVVPVTAVVELQSEVVDLQSSHCESLKEQSKLERKLLDATGKKDWKLYQGAPNYCFDKEEVQGAK